MLHSFEWQGECFSTTAQDKSKLYDAAITFLFNSDFSGNVSVNLPNWIADISLLHGAGPNGQAVAEVHIPFEALKQLVFEHYRRKMIDVLETVGEALEAAVGPAMYKAMEAKLASEAAKSRPATIDNSPETHQ